MIKTDPLLESLLLKLTQHLHFYSSKSREYFDNQTFLLNEKRGKTQFRTELH